MEIRFQPYRKSGTWVVYWKSPGQGRITIVGFIPKKKRKIL